MSSLASRQISYFPTESDLAELFSKAGLPQEFNEKFIKDYASIKRNIDESTGDVDGLTEAVTLLEINVSIVQGNIATLNAEMDAVESGVIAVNVRVDLVDAAIADLTSDLLAVDSALTSHVGASSAHGATGNIVGTDNYATDTIGGTVLLGAAVADAAASTVSVTSPNATAAPAAYNQAASQSVVTLANEMKADINALATDLNNAITQLNALLASQRAAKQIAP